MGMAVGGSGGGPQAEINVTPLVDVLLVLLIIFMVITPLTPKGLDALIPQDKHTPTTPDSSTIVVQVTATSAGSALKINRQEVSWNDLGNRLTDIYKTRADKVLFVSGDKDVAFNDIAQVIDIAHAAQVDKVGLMTSRSAAQE